MLFNSEGFILLFLPAALIAYYFLPRLGRFLSPQVLLILLTLGFYYWGGAPFLPVLFVSIWFNLAMALLIRRQIARERATGALLAAGLVGNLLLLGYYKYANFFIGNVNAVLGSHMALARIALPLGISFFTFQQMGLLIDLARRKVRIERPLDYVSFVLFFPQLLAGPIVRWAELVPQLRQPAARDRIAGNLVVGCAFFSVGLFKKSVIADGISAYAAPVFLLADGGKTPGLVDAWLAAFAYTAQIYFDFSGYSDMAIGVARMLGIILPLNFHSPLRAASVIDIWRRWHVTLSRWAQAYVFQPISVPMTRFALRRGNGKTAEFLLTFAVPTMMAMVVIGIWHGAGWTFVMFGVLQGIYMAVNEYWRQSRKKARRAAKGPQPVWLVPMYQALTLVCFVVSVVLFRAIDLASAGRMYAAMLGLGAGSLDAALAAAKWPGGVGGAVVSVVLVYAVVYLAPNTQQWLASLAPVLEWDKWRKLAPPVLPIRFAMTARWVIASALLFFAGYVMMMRGTTNFIYFNF